MMLTSDHCTFNRISVPGRFAMSYRNLDEKRTNNHPVPFNHLSDESKASYIELIEMYYLDATSSCKPFDFERECEEMINRARIHTLLTTGQYPDLTLELVDYTFKFLAEQLLSCRKLAL